MNSGYPVLYFDGVCNLCNRAVQFFIRNDRKGKFRFASLQSAAGIRAVNAAVEKGQKADSVLLYYKGRYYIKSSAVLKALHLLGGIWKLSAAVYIIPQVLRLSL